MRTALKVLFNRVTPGELEAAFFKSSSTIILIPQSFNV